MSLDSISDMKIFTELWGKSFAITHPIGLDLSLIRDKFIL
jgi:hypothetical protein|tara:strand:+ start:696 stop:815 length:120 start_codon:yes stop_codon:yes gene_type:complete